MAEAVADPSRDLVKLAVVERHFGTGRVGRGFIRGLGLKKGAIASTVAHDHHNLVVAGLTMKACTWRCRRLWKCRAAWWWQPNGRILAQLPLPIAGLMSDQPLPTVRSQSDELAAATRSLGSTLARSFHDPRLHGAFGDPQPQAHRPGPGGRGSF